MALWQSNWVKNALEALDPSIAVELVPVKTAGDRILDVPLANIGGKGLFTKELDDALIEGRIDLAVHSLKDVPYELPAGLVIAAVPHRADPRDAWISRGPHLGELPAGARVGTGSLRRQVQLRRHFPGVVCVDVRGNVDTRLRKLDDGAFDGIILAAAGLTRLGWSHRITHHIDPTVMLPAVGQGALAIVCVEVSAAAGLIQRLDDAPSRASVTAERRVLRAIEASCQIPVGAHATIDDETLHLRAVVCSPDGSRMIETEASGSLQSAVEIGDQVGRRLLEAGARALIDGT